MTVGDWRNRGLIVTYILYSTMLSALVNSGFRIGASLSELNEPEKSLQLLLSGLWSLFVFHCAYLIYKWNFWGCRVFLALCVLTWILSLITSFSYLQAILFLLMIALVMKVRKDTWKFDKKRGFFEDYPQGRELMIVGSIFLPMFATGFMSHIGPSYEDRLIEKMKEDFERQHPDSDVKWHD